MPQQPQADEGGPSNTAGPSSAKAGPRPSVAAAAAAAAAGHAGSRPTAAAAAAAAAGRAGSRPFEPTAEQPYPTVVPPDLLEGDFNEW